MAIRPCHSKREPGTRSEDYIFRGARVPGGQLGASPDRSHRASRPGRRERGPPVVLVAVSMPPLPGNQMHSILTAGPSHDRRVAPNPGLRVCTVNGVVAPIGPSTLAYIRADHIARNYDRLHANNALFAYDALLLDGWFQRPGRLLDLGCGTGRHVEQFARRGFEVTGLDLSSHMLCLARQRLSAGRHRARFVEANMIELEDLGFGSFEYVICMFSTLGMVQGYANRVSFLATVRHRVTSGGLLAFHVHNALRNAWSPWGPLWWLGARLWVQWRGLEFGDRVIASYRSIPRLYIHLFTEREIRGVLADSGWRIRELIALNTARNGPLRGSTARGLRANGFVVLAENPE